MFNLRYLHKILKYSSNNSLIYIGRWFQYIQIIIVHVNMLHFKKISINLDFPSQFWKLNACRVCIPNQSFLIGERRWNSPVSLVLRGPTFGHIHTTKPAKLQAKRSLTSKRHTTKKSPSYICCIVIHPQKILMSCNLKPSSILKFSYRSFHSFFLYSLGKT